MPQVERLFVSGHQNFFHKGTNSRWRDVLTEADVNLYERKIRAELTPAFDSLANRGEVGCRRPKNISRLGVGAIVVP